LVAEGGRKESIGKGAEKRLDAKGGKCLYFPALGDVPLGGRGEKGVDDSKKSLGKAPEGFNLEGLSEAIQKDGEAYWKKLFFPIILNRRWALLGGRSHREK